MLVVLLSVKYYRHIYYIFSGAFHICILAIIPFVSTIVNGCSDNLSVAPNISSKSQAIDDLIIHHIALIRKQNLKIVHSRPSVLLRSLQCHVSALAHALVSGFENCMRHYAGVGCKSMEQISILLLVIRLLYVIAVPYIGDQRVCSFFKV